MKLLADPATSMAFEHALEAAAILTRNDAFSRKDLLDSLEQATYEDSLAKLSELQNVSQLFGGQVRRLPFLPLYAYSGSCGCVRHGQH